MPLEKSKRPHRRYSNMQQPHLQRHAALHSTLTQRDHSMAIEMRLFTVFIPVATSFYNALSRVHLVSVNIRRNSSPLATSHMCF